MNIEDDIIDEIEKYIFESEKANPIETAPIKEYILVWVKNREYWQDGYFISKDAKDLHALNNPDTYWRQQPKGPKK